MTGGATARGVAALLAMTLGSAACGAAPAATEAQPDRALRWAVAVREALAAARERPSQRVRFNPVACDCPPFEVLLGGHWRRVSFTNSDPKDAALSALNAAVDAARVRGETAVWEVQGDFDDALTTCGRGAIVVAFEVSAFGPPEPRAEPPPAGALGAGESHE